jgi:hypothetical protein
LRYFPLVVLSLLAFEAHAQSSIDPTRMTCAQTKAAIRQAGVLVLRWTSPSTGVPRYDRYVRGAAQCSLSQTTASAYVPTRDKKSCGVTKCGPKGDD